MDQAKLESACTAPVSNAKEVKAFFRLLWHELGIDFQPDDDFTMMAEIDPEKAVLLNEQMDKIFDKFGNSTYDMHADAITKG